MIDLLKDLSLLIIGGIFGSFATIYIGRPKIVVSGGGGGGGPGPGYYSNFISVSNEPGFFGIRISETTILGKRIHNRIRIGQVFDRAPAHECRALIKDKSTNEVLGLLWWRELSNPQKAVQTLNLNSGEQAELIIFARLEGEQSKYFVYQPTSPTDHHPIPIDDELKFKETRDFIIEIQYAYGMKKISKEIKMIKGLNGRLTFQGPTGSGSF